MIELEHITKTYKVAQSNAGLGNAFKPPLKRDYKDVKALNDISFKINEGEMVGYIGPNGAGKSTTIKIMCGILTPESGECRINGLIPYKQRQDYVKDIGVVFGNRSALWWDVPVEDSFELLREIYNIQNKYDIFFKVLETKTISQAAKDLGYSQSAVSQSIKSLEEELETTLFIRQKSGVILSKDGHAYLPYLKSVQSSLDNLRTKKQEMKGLDQVTLSIGTFTSVSRHLLPSFMEEFIEMYTHIQIEL